MVKQARLIENLEIKRLREIPSRNSSICDPISVLFAYIPQDFENKIIDTIIFQFHLPTATISGVTGQHDMWIFSR